MSVIDATTINYGRGVEGRREHGIPDYLEDNEGDCKWRRVEEGIDKGADKMVDNNSLGGT